MSLFGKKKMIEKDVIIDDAETREIPVKDNRRFDHDGQRIKVNVNEKTEEPSAPIKSSREIQLETELKSEIERRTAAETKLQEVQKRFDEAKLTLEKETSEMRERLRKTLADQARLQQANFLSTLLPVFDNLKLAIEHAESDASLEHLLDGVKGTARSFENALRETGVEIVSSVGQKFDPEIHEAVEMIEVDEQREGIVTSEFQRGYKFGERLLRPAKVQVGRKAQG